MRLTETEKEAIRQDAKRRLAILRANPLPMSGIPERKYDATGDFLVIGMGGSNPTQPMPQEPRVAELWKELPPARPLLPRAAEAPVKPPLAPEPPKPPPKPAEPKAPTAKPAPKEDIRAEIELKEKQRRLEQKKQEEKAAELERRKQVEERKEAERRKAQEQKERREAEARHTLSGILSHSLLFQ